MKDIKLQGVIIIIVVSLAWFAAGITIGKFGFDTTSSCTQIIENKDLKRVANICYGRGWISGANARYKAMVSGVEKNNAAELINLYKQRDSLTFAVEVDTIFK